MNGSILKAFEILRLFNRDRPELTAATLQAELAMNFATAHRLLTTLEQAGALETVRRGAYRLGLATFAMGRLAEETNPYATRVQPLIDALCGELNESVMVCRLGRGGPVCVAVAAADRPITVSIRVGTTLGILASAQGRLWLADMKPPEREAVFAQQEAQGSALDRAALNAELAEIARQGFARNCGLAEPDIAAVAAPVRNGRGDLMLTVSVFGPLGRFVPTFQDLARQQVQQIARQIEAQLRA